MTVELEAGAADDLVAAGARFAFVHGSRAFPQESHPRPNSDLDVAAWWGDNAPAAWEVTVPGGVDLLVLDDAPLWLAGRVALHGRLLFVTPGAEVARVRWQVDTRMRWLDELPALRQRYEARREQLAAGLFHG